MDLLLGVVMLLSCRGMEVAANYGNALVLDEEFLSTWPANGDIRLVGWNESTAYAAGRLEVFMESEYDTGSGLQPLGGEWGTVCGEKFRLKEANVACRQLGYQSAIGWNYTLNTEFDMANASMPILLSGVRCRNSRFKLHMLRCKHNDIGAETECNHDQDVAVYCSSTRIWDVPYKGQVRLVNDYDFAPAPSYGKVEVYQGRQWGSVCGKNFGLSAADSVCRQLGYTNAAAIGGAPSNGSEVIWVEKISCNKSKSCFTSCFKAHKPSHKCTHQMDVAVQCMFDVSQAKTRSAGSASKCKIKGFPVVWLIVIVCMGLSIVLIAGISIIACLVAFFCCRKRLKARHYEELS